MTGQSKVAAAPTARGRSKSLINKDDMEGDSLAGGGIKLQKACIHCRRSKVKCVHEGKPPCRRCRDANQECKFRLRADDEFWREKTDETLSKLSDAVDTLLNRNPNQLPSQTIPLEKLPGTNDITTNTTTGATAVPRAFYPPRNMSAPSLYLNSTPGYSNSHSNHEGILPIMRPSAYGQIQLPQIPSFAEQAAIDIRSPSNRELASTSDSTSPSFERRISNQRKRELPSEWEPDGYNQPSSSYRSPGSINSVSTPSQMHLRSSSTSNTTVTFVPPAPLAPDQIMPSPVLSYVCSNQSSIYIQGYSTGIRWMMGNTTSYAKATSTIGKDDPRMNAISIGLVPMERARALFIHFAEKMQPHSFGFPTYPANEQMTPLIISSILMISALFDPLSRQYHTALRQDCLASIKPEQEVSASHTLDPELGIGVEEITGACIASTWLGGELAWRISRVARWWTIAYLKHFEIPSRSLTLGECLTILPPFRQIDMIDKLRIWLAAYVAEAQQSFIFDRPSLVPAQNPIQYVDALRNAFMDNSPSSDNVTNDTRGSMTGGSGGSVKYPPPPDRQLIGHASMLNILLTAQRIQREARWAAEAATAREHNNNHDYSPVAGATASQDGIVSISAVRDCVDRVVTSWESWMAQTDRWRVDVSNLEDMSSSTTSAMDLTLTYHLTKAHLGSLALEPEYNASISVAKAASQDFNLLQAQTRIVNTAKASALAAIELATDPMGFRDRLVYLPSFFHFLLGHCAGFLLLLVQRKSRYMFAAEAKTVLELIEQFVQIYVTDIASHNFHPHATSSPHPGLATAEALARSCQHLRAQARASQV